MTQIEGSRSDALAYLDALMRARHERTERDAPHHASDDIWALRDAISRWAETVRTPVRH